MKKLFSLLLAVLLLCSLTACGTTPDDNSEPSTSPNDVTEQAPTLTVAAIQGPTGVGLVNLMAANAAGTALNDYTFSLCTTPQEAMNKLTSDEVLFASVPTNVAASLYNKTSGAIRMLAINTGTVLNILENGTTVKSVADLKGKTIYTTGQGANPEYVLRHLLKKNGLDPDKDVTIEFVTENTELATLLVSGKAKVALVPQPVATTVQMKNASLRVALDVAAEWKKIEPNSEVLMGCLITKASTVEKYPKTVASFLQEYQASINAATADVEKTAGYCESYGVIEKAAVAKAAIPNCALMYKDGEAMQTALQGYYEMLFAANPKAVGGAVPKNDFYYVP